jgi:dienelactone hydrolase
LAGIISEPSGRARFGLILISAGLLPKSGPYRLYTELARRVAEEGVVTLRFDLGGIGDSTLVYRSLPLRERTELEVRAALDYLHERYQLRGLALGGLCSGAEDAFRGAAGDSRVTAVVMIDPFAYKTPGWGWRHLRHRLARRTLRALGLYEPLIKVDKPSTRAVSYRYMARDESEPILRALLARKAKVHFVYTAGMREAFNHPEQLRAQFGDIDFRGLVTLDYLPALDHTQLFAADRRALVERITARIVADLGPRASR